MCERTLTNVCVFIAVHAFLRMEYLLFCGSVNSAGVNVYVLVFKCVYSCVCSLSSPSCSYSVPFIITSSLEAVGADSPGREEMQI